MEYSAPNRLSGADDRVRTGDLNLGKTRTTIQAVLDRAIPCRSVRQIRPRPWSRWDTGWDDSEPTRIHSRIARRSSTRRGEFDPRYTRPLGRWAHRRLKRIPVHRLTIEYSMHPQ